jgi:hypothetical protein
MKKWLLVIIFLIGFGTLLTIQSIDEENNPVTLNKIESILLTLKSFEFIEQQNGLKDYCIYSKEFNNCFQIKADFVPLFEVQKWKQKTLFDSAFIVYIEVKSIGQLNKSNSIFIYGLSDTSKTCYLDLNETIEQNKSSNKFIFYFGITLLSIGIILLLYNLKQKMSPL